MLRTIHAATQVDLPSMMDLLCLEEREWWNLCEGGYIRLLVGRVVSSRQDLTDVATLSRLFAVAPNVRLESSDNLVVLVLNPDWRSAAIQRPDSRLEDLVDLPFAGVESFHPVQERDRAILLANTRRATFQLGAAIFAEAWKHWLVTESVRTRARAGCDLAELADIPLEWRDGSQRERWERLALLLLRPRTTPANHAAVVERFLKLRHEVFEIAQEDHDTPAYRISATVEWVNAFHGIDLETVRPDLYEHLAEVWRALRSFTEEAPPPELVERADEVLRDLRDAMPAAFSEELTPQFISIFLRTFHRAKSKIDSPREILDAIRTVQQGSGIESARLVAFLLAAELGPQKIFQLRQFLTAGLASETITQSTVEGGSTSPDRDEGPNPQAASAAIEAANLGADSPADLQDSPVASKPPTRA